MGAGSPSPPPQPGSEKSQAAQSAGERAATAAEATRILFCSPAGAAVAASTAEPAASQSGTPPLSELAEVSPPASARSAPVSGGPPELKRRRRTLILGKSECPW